MCNAKRLGSALGIALLIGFAVQRAEGEQIKSISVSLTPYGTATQVIVGRGSTVSATVNFKSGAPETWGLKLALAEWHGGAAQQSVHAFKSPHDETDLVNIVISSTNKETWSIEKFMVKGDALQCLVENSGLPLHQLSAAAPGTTYPIPGGCPARPAPPKPPALFTKIHFNITTGGDDLRHDSDAKAVAHYTNGQSETFLLKAKDAGSWDNNSNHQVEWPLGVPRDLAAFSTIAVTLTSHNGTFETDDNWNIQSIEITILGPANASACVFKASGNPFVRLTGSAGTVNLKAKQGCP
jgi:hypothetical protein